MFRRGRKKIEDWKKDKRAEKFAKRIEEEEIDNSRSFEWLKMEPRIMKMKGLFLQYRTKVS